MPIWPGIKRNGPAELRAAVAANERAEKKKISPPPLYMVVYEKLQVSHITLTGAIGGRKEEQRVAQLYNIYILWYFVVSKYEQYVSPPTVRNIIMMKFPVRF